YFIGLLLCVVENSVFPLDNIRYGVYYEIVSYVTGYAWSKNAARILQLATTWCFFRFQSENPVAVE
ncbi:MAG: hypothetical protein IJ171_03440, partial [Ruminococcus sp.]|nr:hypothetical protein [Ruminococcus sp.]